ncbi:gastrula zinc finger protein XlCGF8.2DB-like [Rana temporaria]|uniref:gastrula zinc finger protein XlCGF8.2DB-like n=1 Tax=Rana temporaria TaxID=8407 RepID=UPI001AAD1875|nr:gastrula zinc finger protein XlCGF8.2DB-like [Rana temporaria]
MTAAGTKMSSCLEKVIEKLTAYKEGALTGTSAERRSASTQEGEGPNPTRNSPPKAKVEPRSCEERDTSVDPTMMNIKREPFLYVGGALGWAVHHPLHPSIQIKEEHWPCDNSNFSELFTPVAYTQYRSVHIKEEPREEGDFLNMEGGPPHRSDLESARREDGRPLQGSVFPMSYLCSDSGKAFSHRTHFLSPQHPGGEKPFCCAECGRCFSQRSYFLSHQKIHSGERPFHCFQCAKSFRIKSTLNKHLRSHQMENPFTCPLCHKSFMHRGHFLAHQRLHAEEEKFSCPLCGKSFIHHGHFMAHQRSHAEESRFSCPHCHKSFIHRGHFSAHLRVHTGEKPFPCPDCGSSFSTHHNLVVHQRLHAGSSISFL